MACTLVVNAYPNGVDHTQMFEVFFGTAVFSGSYPSGGETLNWLAMKSGSTTGPAILPMSSAAVPASVDFWTANASGYTYSISGTNPQKLHVQYGGAAVSNPNADIPAAAYPAGVSGDTVYFQAYFPKD